MDVGLIVALAIAACVALIVLIVVRAWRRRERVVSSDQAGASAGLGPPVSRSPPAAGTSGKPAGVLPAALDLDDMADSRILRRMVARACASGKQDQAVQAVMRLAGVSEADARAFVEKLRQRGADEG